MLSHTGRASRSAVESTCNYCMQCKCSSKAGVDSISSQTVRASRQGNIALKCNPQEFLDGEGPGSKRAGFDSAKLSCFKVGPVFCWELAHDEDLFHCPRQAVSSDAAFWWNASPIVENIETKSDSRTRWNQVRQGRKTLEVQILDPLRGMQTPTSLSVQSPSSSHFWIIVPTFHSFTTSTEVTSKRML